MKFLLGVAMCKETDQQNEEIGKKIKGF